MSTSPETYPPITDKIQLASHIDAQLTSNQIDADGYPIGMDDLHTEEWKVVIDALRVAGSIQASTEPPTYPRVPVRGTGQEPMTQTEFDRIKGNQ